MGWKVRREWPVITAALSYHRKTFKLVLLLHGVAGLLVYSGTCLSYEESWFTACDLGASRCHNQAPLRYWHRVRETLVRRVRCIKPQRQFISLSMPYTLRLLLTWQTAGPQAKHCCTSADLWHQRRSPFNSITEKQKLYLSLRSYYHWPGFLVNRDLESSASSL